MSDDPNRQLSVLEIMASSPDVKLRDIGVIGGWLLEQPWVDDEDFDAIEAAKSLIAAQNDAGLGTMILEDLRAHIHAIAAEAAAAPPEPKLEPVPGRVWRYTSPNGDRALVRFDKYGWLTASVSGGGTWWQCDDPNTWPGRFEIVAG